MFAGEMVIALDRRLDYGEARFIGFGPLKGRVMAIFLADECRISSASSP